MPPERLVQLMRPFIRAVRCAIEADVRWLRSQLTADFRIDCMRRVEKHWVRVGADAVGALLNPMAHERNGIARCNEWRPVGEQRRSALEALRQLRAVDPDVAGACWSHRFPEFDHALEARRDMVKEEGRDALTLAGLELGEAESTLQAAQNRGNRGQITRVENQRNEAAAVVEMTRAMWEQRDAWLRDCVGGVRAVRPKERVAAMLRVQRLT